MSGISTKSAANRQLPVGDEIFLDHVGHFVRDPKAASAALARAGFAPTPASVQVNPDPAGGPPQPTGTGNVTVMLARGYLEMLFKTADTPLGHEFDAALAQHSGIHLAALSVADAQAALARLAASGFRVRPLVNFQRPVTTETGMGTAAFTVARVERGEMVEGRIQILTHRSEDMVWQKRWLTHPNGAAGLIDVVIATAALDAAAERFFRFTGRSALPIAGGRTIGLDRGGVVLIAPDTLAAMLPEVSFPRLPIMAAYALEVASLDAAEAVLARGGINMRRAGRTLVACFPAEIGVGAWVFAEDAANLPWRR